MVPKREKDVLDQVADGVVMRKDRPAQAAGKKSPTTKTRAPVEEQVRKEWDSKKDGGLSTSLR